MNKSAMGVVCAALLAIVGVSAPAGADPAGVFRTLDWESPADHTVPDRAPSGFIKQWTTPYGATVVNGPTRDGSFAARFELRRTDPPHSGSTRAEIVQPDAQPLNVERWYGFSVYLPPEWVRDPAAEIVSQWHQCDACGGGSPPLALITRNGQWQIDFRGSLVDLGAYATGRWTDWVFHVRWLTTSAGLAEAWRDGQPVFNRAGATFAGGPRSPYFKFGIYKWAWSATTDRRVMYYDALRLGDERAGRQDVDPTRGGTACGATLPVVGATATTWEPVNPPAHAVDGNLATRWSGQGFGASLILDLGGPARLCGSKVAWHRGNLRWNDYTVYVSADGSAYHKVWEGRSSGTTTQPETELFPAGPRDARFVKISFWQNPENDWASITEASPASPELTAVVASRAHKCGFRDDCGWVPSRVTPEDLRLRNGNVAPAGYRLCMLAQGCRVPGRPVTLAYIPLARGEPPVDGPGAAGGTGERLVLAWTRHAPLVRASTRSACGGASHCGWSPV